MNLNDERTMFHSGWGLAIMVAASALGNSAAAWAGGWGDGKPGIYDVAVLSQGSSTIHAEPGETIPVDVVLTRHDQYDVIESASFDVHISNGGLLFEDYEWDYAFGTGTPNDESTRPTTPPSMEESLHFENLTLTAEHLFLEGTILSLKLTIPTVTLEGTEFEVDYLHGALVEPNLFSFSHDVNLQGPLTINVVPEPATVVLLGVGGLALWRRPRQS